jgi:hypothetical protein
MNAPRIELVPVRSWAAFYEVRSSNETLRFRVLGRSKFTLIDADWFSTRWELAPAARDAIFAHCEDRASQWGGGKACLIIHADLEHAAELQQFLTRILADPSSWLRWNRDSHTFVPLHLPLEAAA